MWLRYSTSCLNSRANNFFDNRLSGKEILKCIHTWLQLDAVVHSAAALPLKVGARLTFPRFHLLHLLGGHDDDRAKYSILPCLAGDIVRPFDYHSLHFILCLFYSENKTLIYTHIVPATILLLNCCRLVLLQAGCVAAYWAEEYSCT